MIKYISRRGNTESTEKKKSPANSAFIVFADQRTERSKVRQLAEQTMSLSLLAGLKMY